MFNGNGGSDIIILDDAENNNDDAFDAFFDVFTDLKSFAHNNKFCQGLSIHENSKVSSASKKIGKDSMRLTNKKPSKKAKV